MTFSVTSTSPASRAVPTGRTAAGQSCAECGGNSACNCGLAGPREAGDTAEFSPEALAAAERADAQRTNSRTSDTKSPTAAADANDPEAQTIRKLKERDAEVRRHEQAHVAAGGAHVKSGPHYEYQTGPDGKQYAIGGHVQIDVSPVPGDPDATIRKMQTVRAAALAPAEPSGADHSVAASASALEAAARTELAQQRRDELRGSTGDERGSPREALDVVA